MIQIEDKPKISAAQAKEMLTKHTGQYGICLDLDRILEYKSYYMCKYNKLLKDFRIMAGDGSVVPTQRQRVREILIYRFGIDDASLQDKGNKASIGKNILNNVLEDYRTSTEAKEFINLYKECNIAAYYKNYLYSYSQAPLLKAEAFNNARMVLVKPEWRILATSRLGAGEPSIQNIPRIFSDLITYPKGSILLRADSGQIEPRITYSTYILDKLIKHLILLYNDAYFGMLHFITMTPEEERSARENINLVVKKDLPKSDRQILKTMLLAGNYGSQLTNFEPRLANGFKRKIVNHPLRLKLEKEVSDAVYGGAEQFYSAFGTVVKPEDSKKYERGTQAWINHLIRCGINNPIQTTASDLMCEAVYLADKIIYNEARGNTYIGYFKHDEGAFYIDEKDSNLIDKLAETTSYQVRDWIPIYADKLIGVKEPERIEGVDL